MMRTVVTGGGGFLGSAIARMLRDRGDKVTILSRRHFPEIQREGIASVAADIRDEAALVEPFRGTDVIFHTAALTGVWGNPADFEQINVEGTRNVIQACRRTGVQRLIYTSSPSVVFGTAPLCDANESQPYPARFLADYPRTKAAAEQLVRAAHGPSLCTIALRPHLVFGPGDPHLIPRVIERARSGRLRIVGRGDNLVDVTYIDNAAAAHLCAADAPCPIGAAAGAGAAYFISQGKPVSLWPWLNGILGAVGAPCITRRIPYRAAHLIGTVCEAAYVLSGRKKEPLMTRFVAAQLAHNHYFNIAAARQDLDYTPSISTEEGVRRTVEALQGGSV